MKDLNLVEIKMGEMTAMNINNPAMGKVTVIESTWKVLQLAPDRYCLMEWKDTLMVGSITFKQLKTLNAYLNDNNIQCKCDHLT